MSLRVVNIVTYLLLGIFGIWVFYLSDQLGRTGEDGQFGSGHFPGLLAIGLIVLSVIGIIQWLLNKEGKRTEIPPIGKVIGMIGLLSLYFITWSLWGYFYLQTFIFLLVMLTIYRLPLGMKRNVIAVNLAVAVVTTAFIYLVFNEFMYVQF